MTNKSRWTLPALGVVLFALLSFSPTPIHAQSVPGWDFSLSGFVGAAIPFNPDADATNLPTGILTGAGLFVGTGTGTFHDVDLKTSFAFGGKLSAWTTGFRSATGLDFGAEIDVTHFNPEADGQIVNASGQFTSGGVTVSGTIPFMLPSFEITSTIVAANLLTRLPLYQNQTFPNGRLQWYLGLGLGADMAKLDISGSGSEDDTALAFQALAGGKVFLTPHIALFGEYKFTHASHTWNFSDTKIEADLDVNHALFGVAVHF